MTSERFVLVVSTMADVATDDVVRRLASRSVPYRRLNTEEFPFSSSIALAYGGEPGSRLTIDGEPLPEPTSIWYRRFRSAAKPLEMDKGSYEFCLRESRAALVGGVLGMRARWMSHPAMVWQAEHKPYQLAVAQELGLRIPRTVITNDAARIRKAARSFERTVVKPTRTGHLIYENTERAIFTSELLPVHLEDLSGTELSPAIYQELVPKRFDVRVTVVGRRVFAATIDSQSDPAAAVDWRQTDNPALPHERMVLPDELERTLLRLTDRLQLNFAAIDLVQTLAGDFVFLEVNPNGQWLWLDDMLELGISEAVAEWLSEPRVA